MVTKRQRYHSLGAGQPPQRRLRARRAPGYCISCGSGVIQFAPQRPMCIDCWSDNYQCLPIRNFRDSSMRFCHRCGSREQITYGAPLCSACDQQSSLAVA